MATVEAIETVYIETDNVASVTFSSLGSYQHLQLRLSTKSDRNYYIDAVDVFLNNDTGSSYAHKVMRFSSTGGTGAFSYGSSLVNNNPYISFNYQSGDPDEYGSHSDGYNERGNYSFIVADILDYGSANKNAQINLSAIAFSSSRNATSAGQNWKPQQHLSAFDWENSAALTSIKLEPRNGTYFMRGSELSIYGWNVS